MPLLVQQYAKILVCPNSLDILRVMSICLSMIVKNEAHCIKRCLESVKPFITYWIICDTGSSDNTEEVVKECLKDIPGEYHKHEWKDFATNRNMATALSKDKANYTLIMDADDFLITNERSFKDLHALAYRIQIIHDNITHLRPQLIHNSIDYKYVGVVHEYMDIPPYVAQKLLPDCQMIIRRDGARAQDPQRYLKDALALEAAIKEDPTNSRYVFYCAQSYRDYGDLEKALIYYMKRSEMEGFKEERYVSLLEAGKIMENLRFESIQDITVVYFKAHEQNPNRIESLFYLASYYRRLSLFAGAYAVAKTGSLIPRPIDAMFLEPDCYNWKIFDELAVAAYYLGKFKESAEINQKLLDGGVLPDYARPRIIENLAFCQGKY
jgi:glycosyltransferase involved in cell wall biosynthesis